ncbi:MAG TPA: DNA helicase [Rhizomicrobium sp.]|jgi:replicative DNA helicase|nr:DNA helicase [Rhizomicrobium sp.]
MKLSAPVYRLRRNAKLLSREKKMPLVRALDEIARQEGYKSWSLLAARLSAEPPAAKLFSRLIPGDLLLVGARPGHGKTLLGLELAMEAIKAGSPGKFFSLEFGTRDVQDCLHAIGVDHRSLEDGFEFDSSDAISADYLIPALASAPIGTLVVIDYLQLLDQNRDRPALLAQVQALKSFASQRGLILVFLSQIGRSYDPAEKPCPGLGDVRLPNPMDLTLFNKACFLHNGAIDFQAVH